MFPQKKLSFVAAALLAGFQVHAAADALPAAVPLSDETPVVARQDWGALASGKSIGGNPLTVGGVAFAAGLGMHANGEAEYDLDSTFATFEAKVGVDDAMKSQPKGATVVFQVYVDGVKKFDSGLMRAGDAAKPVSVDVRGAQTLKLVALNGGDGNAADHADWCDAKLIPSAPDKALIEPAHTITVGDMQLVLDKNGGVAGIVTGGKTWPVSGATKLEGCKSQGAAKMKLTGESVSFTRLLADAHGHRAEITDSFAPNGKGGVRWTVEIKSDDAPWSCPITSRLNCADTKNTQFWTGWGSPDLSGTENLSPELMEKIAAGQAAVSSAWSDPLVPCAFVNRSWHYGNIARNIPVGDDYVALPLITLTAPKDDAGLSLVLSPEDVMLGMDLIVTASGRMRYTRTQHRLGGGKPVVFHMDIVPHEAGWRGGLRFMTERYPQFFEAPNPRAHKIAACGAYSIGEEKIDVAKFKRMAFGFNWKLSDDFPYMGMFIPPVKSMDEIWTRSGAEKSAAYVGPTTSCRRMNDYAKYMKENGFSVLSYFNVTEFGKDMNVPAIRQPVRTADDPELWKDPAGFVKFTMPEAIVDPKITTCYAAYVMDPGEPIYQAFLLEQAKRNCDMLPDTDGICIDRADWLRISNRHADDGVSWLDGKPARSLFRSWIGLMEKLGPLMHERDKVIFANLMTVRLELSQHLDAIYTEYGQSGNALNSAALLCLKKPAICWTQGATPNEPNPDAFMQRHLYMGCFPTAPFPHNHHCINPNPKADALYQEYGKLLDALRGKKWVLAQDCVATTTAGAKVNLFEVPGGYALPVTFGGDAKEALVRVKNIPSLGNLRAHALHPGEEMPVAVTTTLKDGVLELRVPLSRGCAMVTLSPRGE